MKSTFHVMFYSSVKYSVFKNVNQCNVTDKSVK